MADEVTIYHNPRCRKSRETLALLHDRGIDPTIIEYLSSPPNSERLQELLGLLGIEAKDLVRPKEQRDLGLPKTDDHETLIDQMASHPKIIQRPIVVANGSARLGRPPESVLEIL